MDGQYLTITAVRERGWSDSAITTLLGEPDLLKPNPRRRSMKMKLFRTERVEAAEKTDQYAIYAAKKAHRAAVGAPAREERKRRLEAEREAEQAKVQTMVDAWTPQVSVMPLATATHRAIRHYNDRQSELAIERGHSFDLATKDSEPDFLRRITVNYLRHTSSDYEDMLTRVAGLYGADEAAHQIRRRVQHRIGELYPDLAGEAAAQTARREQEASAARFFAELAP